MDPNAYWISFVRFNQGLSSITKKGEIESASRPLVDFGVLNDNLIKGLISCVKCISRSLIKVQMYSLINVLKYNYEASGTMWSMCTINQQIVSYWRIYVKSSKKTYMNKKKFFKNKSMEDMKCCVGQDGSWRRINKDLTTMNHALEKSKWESWCRGTGYDG
jgi:hypothetical protein